jgi:hypothetical protein
MESALVWLLSMGLLLLTIFVDVERLELFGLEADLCAWLKDNVLETTMVLDALVNVTTW